MWNGVLHELWIFAPVAVAAGLSLIVGLEREYFNKAAGIRTHALVGIGSALFTVVGAYGFTGGSVALDPTRVAAQIVSGIGFIGAGIIFVRKDSVRGLTTAASIWVVAAIGMAAGARLYLVASLSTALYLIVVAGIRQVERMLANRKVLPPKEV